MTKERAIMAYQKAGLWKPHRYYFKQPGEKLIIGRGWTKRTAYRLACEKLYNVWAKKNEAD